MKNILSICRWTILGILIIPQITFAAWWNPLSWSIFHKVDTKTQILEKRIVESENKLASTTTQALTATTTTNKKTNKSAQKSTDSVTPHSNSVQPIPVAEWVEKGKPTAPITTQQPSAQNNKIDTVTPVQENFSIVLASSYAGQAKLYESSVAMIDTMIQTADSRISYLTNMRNQTQIYTDGIRAVSDNNGGLASVLVNALDLYIKLYDADIRSVNLYRDSFIAVKNNFMFINFTYFRNLADSTLREFVTRERAISEIKLLNSSNALEDVLKTLDNQYSSLKEWVTKSNNNYAQLDIKLKTYMAGLTNTNLPSNIPVYVAPSIPTLTSPLIRNTYCDVYGSRVSCKSYSF